MDALVKEFIASQRVCSLTTLKSDGSPHAAVMHYSESFEPVYLYFSCDRTQLKVEGLLDGLEHQSSVAIGFSEEDWVTVQLDGSIRLVLEKDEIAEIKKIHYQKIPTSQNFEADPNTVFLRFAPTWWRYTNFNEVPPKQLLMAQ